MAIPRLLLISLTGLLMAGLFLISSKPALIWLLGMGLTVGLGLGLFVITTRRLWSLDFWRMSITPIWLWLGSLSMLIVVEQNWARWLIIIAAPLLIGIILDQIRLFYHRPAAYQPYALEHLSGTANLITIFAVCASLYGLRLLLGLPWILLIPLSLCAIALLTYQTFWVNKIDHRQSWRWLAGISLVIPELFVVVGFLPTGYLVSGLVITAGFYLAVNLGRLTLLNSINRRVLSQYVTVSVTVMVMVLLTARWI